MPFVTTNNVLKFDSTCLSL